MHPARRLFMTAGPSSDDASIAPKPTPPFRGSVVLKKQPIGGTSLTHLIKVCAETALGCAPKLTMVSSNPFKARVELAGQAFETVEYFDKKNKALQASCGLAKQWIFANVPGAAPKKPKVCLLR